MHAPGTRLKPGIGAALASALLFGAATPLAKALMASTDPWLMAGLLYLGSGLGLFIYRVARRAEPVRLPRNERAWFLGAILCGGVIAPVLLMQGLARMPASGASLLLNLEAVFTALLAWFAFRENVDRRVALGMLLIVAGGVALSVGGSLQFAGLWPALGVGGACLFWALDNNLTRKVSLNDATWIASVRGLVAGPVNLAIGLVLGARLPAAGIVSVSLVLGLLSYGISLALFVAALRHLGTARTGAYFSVAPFFGATLAVILLGEPLTAPLLAAGGLMALGVWLHLTEQHAHEHTHEALEHEHEHVHDDHHQHGHDAPVAPGARHTHLHRHEPLTHTHAHFPDAHHRHPH